jgi:hypothetical protein
MKILHILKTKPNNTTIRLMAAFGDLQGEEATLFEFYDEEADCEKLIDLIFEHEKIISWW